MSIALDNLIEKYGLEEGKAKREEYLEQKREYQSEYAKQHREDKNEYKKKKYNNDPEFKEKQQKWNKIQSDARQRMVDNKIGPICYCCLEDEKELEVHHVNPKDINKSLDENNQPENIKYLCKDCHKKVHRYYNRYKDQLTYEQIFRLFLRENSPLKGD